ncbi:MAG: L-lysine 6-transaminase [Ignavibacteria bacterium]|nr:L-lysine 6-transaminase [Ignavibacteria bacterium]
MKTKSILSYKPKYSIGADQVLDELKKHMLIDGFNIVLDLYDSAGSTFIDARTRQKYLDFFTCFATLPVGFNHPKLLEENYLEYLGRISVNKPSNSDIYTEAMATFVNTFFKIAVPDYFKYSFFISGGTLAVENALKAAFDRKVRKNFSNGYKFEHGQQILHFKHAFHGRSGYTMSLTNTDPVKTEYYPKFSWPRVLSPFIEFPENQENIERTIDKENDSIREIQQAFYSNKDDIAAIIIEPIQGEGGDNHFRKEFLQQLRILADENDALLIFDEVQCGLGITGKWWTHQHFNVQPDIMTFGKKTQICGILVGDKIDDIPDNVFHTPGRINSTWGGSLADMVRSTKYLEIIEEENLLQNVSLLGTYLMNELNEIQVNNPDLVSNVRGKGLFCAFDLASTDLRNKFRQNCFDNGLLILPCGNQSIRFRPALNIKKENLQEGLEIIRKALIQL